MTMHPSSAKRRLLPLLIGSLVALVAAACLTVSAGTASGVGNLGKKVICLLKSEGTQWLQQRTEGADVQRHIGICSGGIPGN